jgi:O-antigen/teichoic acid export membrane protein
MRTNGDSLIVGGIVSVQAAGIYNVARQLAGVVRKLNGIYTAILFPEITRLSAFGDLDGALKLKSRMTRMGVLAGMIGVAGAALAGGFAINLLFGPRFAAAYIPFVILTAAALAQLISFTPSMYVQVYRSPRLLLLLTSIATIAFAVCGVALTFALSITGTAVAHLLFAIALILLCEFALRGVFDTSRAVRSPPWDKLNPEDT